MTDFCAMCHSSKADPNVVKNLKMFNSMDERSYVPAAVTPAAPASAPAAPKRK
ncbi:MAG: hypothetical protein AABZ25_09450 [Nitrospirota bacterium]